MRYGGPSFHNVWCEDAAEAEPGSAVGLYVTYGQVTVASGHWMAQEKPVVVNAALVRWLAREFPDLWPA
jgi:hypothetical protein